jgi:hypothetical protein
MWAIQLIVAWVVSWFFVWAVLVAYEQNRTGVSSYFWNDEVLDAEKKAAEANKQYLGVLSAKAACWLTFLLFLVWAGANR